jgi:hypothetical protein
MLFKELAQETHFSKLKVLLIVKAGKTYSYHSALNG